MRSPESDRKLVDNLQEAGDSLCGDCGVHADPANPEYTARADLSARAVVGNGAKIVNSHVNGAAVYNRIHEDAEPVDSGISGGLFKAKPDDALLVGGVRWVEADGPIWAASNFDQSEFPDHPEYGFLYTFGRAEAGAVGRYWSAEAIDGSNEWYLDFSSNDCIRVSEEGVRNSGMSVRVVRDAVPAPGEQGFFIVTPLFYVPGSDHTITLTPSIYPRRK